jgi:hypothetical protein
MLEYIDSKILDTALLCSDDNIFLSTIIDFKKYNESMRQFNMIAKLEHYSTDTNFFFLGFNWHNFIRKADPILQINQCLYHSTFIKDLSVYEREFSRCASILTNTQDGPLIFEKIFPEIKIYLKSTNRDIGFVPIGRPINNMISEALQRSPKTLLSLRVHLSYGWELK